MGLVFRIAAVVGILGLSVALAFTLPQDPPKHGPAKQDPPSKLTVPQPPPGAEPLPPVPDPPRTAVERRDLLQRFTAPSPLEGYYALRVFTNGISAVAGATGYLAMGRRFLSLHLQAPRAGGPPAIQSGFREYRVEGNQLVMTTLLGMQNQRDGDIVLERRGALKSVAFVLTGTRLRLDLGNGRVLEFERIE